MAGRAAGKKRGRNYGLDESQLLYRDKHTKKKPCERGKACPYQHEYQHKQEFSHDNDPLPAFGGPSRKLGVGRGPSVRIGSSGHGGSRSDRVGTGTMMDYGYVTGDKIGSGAMDSQGFEPYNADDFDEMGDTTGEAGDEFDGGVSILDESAYMCPTCMKNVPLCDIESHSQLHEQEQLQQAAARERERLLRAQEEELEASMISDVTRATVVEMEQLKEQYALRRSEEEEEIKRVLRLSSQQAGQVAKERARSELSAEPSTPSTEKLITLKFIFPDGTKQTRRFLKDSSAQDASKFALLQPPSGSVGIKLLRTADGSIKVSAGEQRTFRELGVTSNTALIVVPAEDNIASPLAAPSTGTKSRSGDARKLSSSSASSSSTPAGAKRGQGSGEQAAAETAAAAAETAAMSTTDAVGLAMDPAAYRHIGIPAGNVRKRMEPTGEKRSSALPALPAPLQGSGSSVSKGSTASRGHSSSGNGRGRVWSHLPCKHTAAQEIVVFDDENSSTHSDIGPPVAVNATYPISGSHSCSSSSSGSSRPNNRSNRGTAIVIDLT